MSRQIELPISPKQKFKRRKKMVLHIGVLHRSHYSVGSIEDLLKSYKIKVRVTRCGLSGFCRFIVDAGYTTGEDERSIAGKKYSQIATLEVLTYRPILVVRLIRSCGVEFTDEIIGEHCHIANLFSVCGN